LTVEFSRSENLTILRKEDPVVVQLATPQEVAKATEMPLYEKGKLVVARCDLDKGIIYLGRDDRTDFYYEMAKWRFWPKDYWTDLPKWRGIADKFTRLAAERKVE
jgi:hypothetical protein